jgi:tetratricopeptide (TPR) repeat protein
LKKGYPEAYNAISVALARIGRIPEAVDHAEKAIRGRPKFVPFRFNLANLYMLQRKGEDALRVLDQILMINPGNPAAESMKMQIIQQFNGGRGNRPGGGGMRMPPPRR